MQRKGVPFTGFVPTTAMVTPDTNGNYDESSNPFSTQLNNPYPYITTVGGVTTSTTYPFICNAATGLPVTPNPAGVNGGGSQGPPTVATPACDVIPASMISPQVRPWLRFIRHLTFQAIPSITTRTNPFESSTREHGTSASTTIFPARTQHLGASATTRQPTTSPEARRPGRNKTLLAATNTLPTTGATPCSPKPTSSPPATINQFNAGFNRIFNHILSYGTGSCEAATLDIPGADLGSKCDGITGYPAGLNQATNDCESCGLTSFQMSSYFSIGDRGYAPYQGGTNVYSVGDTIDLIRGKHDIRVGATYRAEEMNIRNNAFQDGYVVNFALGTNDNIGDLLLGAMGVFAAHDQTFLGATVGRRFRLIRPFVQDDWRVTSNLTLNLGVAWALVTPETEVKNRQANFDVTNLTWYVPAGSPGITGCANCVSTNGRVGIQFDKTALEPRIGLAWKPFGGDKTVVRSGYSIYHDSSWDQGGQGLWQNPPYYAEVDPAFYPNVTPFSGVCAFGATNCGLSFGFLLQCAPTCPASTTPVGNGAIYSSPVNPQAYSGTIQSMNRNFKQGVIQQFNLNVERQLPGDIVLTVGYAGTRSAHILVSQVDENIRTPPPAPTTAVRQDTRWVVILVPPTLSPISPIRMPRLASPSPATTASVKPAMTPF